ncbi:MAG: hypothetical protein PHX47_02800 [Candidatus ainarchaeum sp.]|nr:hypothetical protein [Candidatus ainarchaeum sp.]
MKTNNPALKKNPYLKNLKKDPSIQGYKTLAEIFVKNKSNASKLSKNVVLDQKFLANHRILSARVKHKINGLSKVEQEKAKTLFENIFSKFLWSFSKTEKHHEFIKEFAKSINRKEGREVLEILENVNKKLKGQGGYD